MTTVSEVSICNMALSWLGAQPIIALTDNTIEGNLCNTNYEISRDAVLELRDWSFAISRVAPAPVVLPAGTLALHDGYYPFTKPSNQIRMITVASDSDYHLEVQWYIEGSYIWADSETIFIKYVFREEDPTQFSSNFAHALASFIAQNLAVPISGSREMQDLMAKLFAIKLETAGAFDGMQGKNQPLKSKYLTRVR